PASSSCSASSETTIPACPRPAPHSRTPCSDALGNPSRSGATTLGWWRREGPVTRSRRIVGWLLFGVGAVVIALGAACAALVGPDNGVSSGLHRLTSAGPSIVTADDTVDGVGPTLRV